MKRLKGYWPYLAGMACVAVLVGFAGQGNHPPCLERVATTSSTTATELWASGDCKMAPRSEVCFWSGSTDPTYKLYLSSFSSVDENLAWPLYGGQKECHDWDAGAKLWVFHGDGTTGVEFKSWSVK